MDRGDVQRVDRVAGLFGFQQEVQFVFVALATDGPQPLRGGT